VLYCGDNLAYAIQRKLVPQKDDDGFSRLLLLDDSRGLSAVADAILKCDYKYRVGSSLVLAVVLPRRTGNYQVILRSQLGFEFSTHEERNRGRDLDASMSVDPPFCSTLRHPIGCYV
jgi:hypothetical protein